MKTPLLYLFMTIILIGMSDIQSSVAFTPEDVSINVGDKIIYEIVQNLSDPEDDYWRAGTIIIKEITQIPSDIGKESDIIMVSSVRKYKGNIIQHNMDLKSNLSSFGNDIIYTNWTYWKNNLASFYNYNSTEADFVMIFNISQTLDMISFSVKEVSNHQSNSTHKIENIIGFDIGYEISTGIMEDLRYYGIKSIINLTEPNEIYSDTWFDTQMIRIQSEPNYAISNNKNTSIYFSIQTLALVIVLGSKFRNKVFNKITGKSLN